MSDETVRRLEEKIAFLEHHVTQQDKVMLEMGEELGRLKRQLQLLGERLGRSPRTPDDPLADPDERPPHY